jgi:hypothetical protein
VASILTEAGAMVPERKDAAKIVAKIRMYGFMVRSNITGRVNSFPRSSPNAPGAPRSWRGISSSSFAPASHKNGFSSAREQAVAKVDENYPRDEQCCSGQFNYGDITHWDPKETDPVH